MMTGTVLLNLDRPVSRVEVIGGQADAAGLDSGSQQPKIDETYVETDLHENITAQSNALTELCGQLEGLVRKAACSYDEMVKENKEAIARLSVEIAAKILAAKVEEGDYKIEEIVKASLEGMAEDGRIFVHLNPKDYETVCRLREAGSFENFKDIEFTADPSLGGAECRIKTANGTIESLIERQLEQVSNAFKRMV